MRVYYIGPPIVQIRSGGGKYYEEVLEFLEQNSDLEYWDFMKTSWQNRMTYLGLNLRALITVTEATLWAIKQLKKTEKGEVIFVNSFYKGFFFLFVWIVKYVYRRNLLCTVNGLYYYFRTPFLNFLDRTLMRTFLIPATVVVVNSKAMKKEIATLGIPESKIKVVYPRLDHLPMVENPLSKEEKDFFEILFVGYSHPVKEIHILIQAIGKLKHIPLRLHIVGSIDKHSSYAQQLQALIEKFNIKKRVIFHGKLVGKKLSQKYAMADSLVVPGQGEGYGRVTIEAMHFGLPVIGANHGGSKELIADRVNGFLFKGGDADDLAEKILKLYKYKNTELYKKMSQGAKEAHKKANFHNNIGRQFLRIIKGIGQSGPLSHKQTTYQLER